MFPGTIVYYRDVVDTVEGAPQIWPSILVRKDPLNQNKVDLTVCTPGGVKTLNGVVRGSGYGQWGTRGEYGVQ